MKKKNKKNVSKYLFKKTERKRDKNSRYIGFIEKKREKERG